MIIEKIEAFNNYIYNEPTINFHTKEWVRHSWLNTWADKFSLPMIMSTGGDTSERLIFFV